MVGWPKNEKGLKKMAAAEWYFSCVGDVWKSTGPGRWSTI